MGPWPGTTIGASEAIRSSSSAQRRGSPCQHRGVTPKLHMAPANRIWAPGTSATRFSVIWPPVASTATASVSWTSEATTWLTGRVTTSSKSSAWSGNSARQLSTLGGPRAPGSCNQAWTPASSWSRPIDADDSAASRNWRAWIAESAASLPAGRPERDEEEGAHLAVRRRRGRSQGRRWPARHVRQFREAALNSCPLVGRVCGLFGELAVAGGGLLGRLGRVFRSVAREREEHVVARRPAD